jgi:ubiquitin-protein ligase
MAKLTETRLKNEYEDLQEIAERSPYIEILDTDGRNPPEEYEIKLICKGISKLDSDKNPVYTHEHKLRFLIPAKFPTDRPLLSMITPVWHPNIASNGNIDYGDWGIHSRSPSMKISDLIIRVIEIIRYENVCVISQFNHSATLWYMNHKHLFPLDTGQIIF